MISVMLVMTSIPWGTVTAETEQDNRAGTGQVQLKTAESKAAESSDAVKQEEPDKSKSEEQKAEQKEPESGPSEKKDEPAEEKQKDEVTVDPGADQNTADKNDDKPAQENNEDKNGNKARKAGDTNGLKLNAEPDEGAEDTGEEEDTSETDDWLSELIFYNGSTADTAEQYELVPYFEPEQHEYTLFVPDTESGIYAYGISSLAQSRDYTTSGGTYVTYTDTRNNEQEINASMYWEGRNGNPLTRCISKGDTVNDLTIYTPDGTKEYIVHVRRITSLMSLKAEYGEEQTELFRKGVTSYTLRVPKNCEGETLTLIPKAYIYTYDDDTIGNENYQIRITDGDRQETVTTGSPYTHTFSGREETVSIRVSSADNRETVYRVRIQPTDTGSTIAFSTDTEGAEAFRVWLYNEDGNEMKPDAEDPHVFRGLFTGSTYKYRASFGGYKSISGNIEAEEGTVTKTITFSEKATGRFLDEIKLYPNASGNTDADYAITRDPTLDEIFGGTVYTAEYSSRMTSNACYLAASLSDSAPEGSMIRVSAYDITGTEQTMKLPDSEGGTPIRRKLPGTIFDVGAKRAVYKVTAGTEEDNEQYILLITRTLELKDLSLCTSDDGETILEDKFVRTRHEYEASVMKSVELLFAMPKLYEDDDFTVNIDGDQIDGEYGLVFLTEDHIQRIQVDLSKEETYSDPAYVDLTYTSEGSYTIDVERLSPAKVVFQTEPENAVVTVYDRKGERVYSDLGDNKSYSSLFEGREYSYVCTLYGCVSKVGSFVAADGDVIEVELDSSKAKPQKDVGNVEWWNYRNNEENNGVTDASTPDDPEKTAQKWAIMIGGDYNSSCTPPIIAGGYVYTAVGKYIYRLDKDTGEILAVSEELAGDVVFALNPMTYAEGMLFVQIGKGRIQAVGCDSLRSIWISEKLGGQTLSPITYKDGYIYTGTWSSETKAGEYFALSVTDEDDTRGDETKYCSWRYSHKGGFYWAGAYATSDYVVFGSDDGENEGDYSNSAVLYSVSARTGDIIQEVDDIEGDIRTSIVYDDGYIYFATKGGVLYRIKMNDNGTFGQVVSFALGGMATASPVVYNGRVYIGVCGEGGQFNADGGHHFAVLKSDKSGLSEIYTVDIPGYPQAAALLSTGYRELDYDVDGNADGRIYIYFTYNAKPGGIAMITDEPGQTAGELKIIYEPEGNQQEYCISPIATDSDGTLYYKNDSGYLMAVTSNNAYVRDIELTPSAGEAFWEEDFDPGKLKYNIRVDNEATETAVKINVPTGRKVTVNGELYKEGMKVALSESGNTLIEVKVTYQNKTRTYKLNLESLGNDATLSDIIVGSSNNIFAMSERLTLTPGFDAEQEEYVTAEYTGDNRFLNIWPVTSGKYATTDVEAVLGVKKINTYRNAAGSDGKTRYAVYFGDGESEAVVDVRVTAGDGKTEKIYRVHLIRTDNYPPNLTNIIAKRDSAEKGTVTFTSNEEGTFYYAVTDIDASQPVIYRTNGIQLVKGENRIELSDLAGEGKKVWIIAEDKIGNVSKTPVSAVITQYEGYSQTITVTPKDAALIIKDSDGNTVEPASSRDGVYTYTLINGNTYSVNITRFGYADVEDVFTADKLNPSSTYELKSMRSADNDLKGLYASSSDKYKSGMLKLTPSFDKDVIRYQADYSKEKSYLNVWPVVSDKKATVSVFAVSGIKADTVNEDETLTASDADGHPFYRVYFADGSFKAEVRVHVVAEDETAKDYFLTLTIKDTTPPSIGRVSASRIAKDKASVVFKCSEVGQYYYKVVKEGAAAPKIDTSGKGKECLEGTTTITLTGLSKGKKDVYIIVKDEAGNLSKMIKMTVPEWKGKKSSQEYNSDKKNGGSEAEKGTAQDGKDAGLKVASSKGIGGKSAGTALAKKKGAKPNTKIKKAKNLKKGKNKAKEDSAKEGKSSNDAAAGTTGDGGSGSSGSGSGSGDLSEQISDGLKNLAHDVNKLFDLFVGLIWWQKALILIAGPGILYILFWCISRVKRRREKAALIQANSAYLQEI